MWNNTNHRKKSYAVFGMGEFGKSVAIELAKSGADVLAIDVAAEEMEGVADYVTEAKIMDASDIHAYAKIDLSSMDGVVVSMSRNINAELMAILQAVEAGVPVIVAKALNETQAKIFEKIGATDIITPERSEGKRLARALASSDIFDFVELKDNLCMLEIGVRKEWAGKSLMELHLRDQFGINVIAIYRDNVASTAINPAEPLDEEAHLLIVTDKESATRYSKRG